MLMSAHAHSFADAAHLRIALSRKLNKTLVQWHCEQRLFDCTRHDQAAMATPQHPRRYLTFVLGNETHVPCCPGFMHIAKCGGTSFNKRLTTLDTKPSCRCMRNARRSCPR